MREHGAAVVQQFGEDFLPLIMLFAISITGLMLTASYTWLRGYAYDFLAILHAVTVIFTLLWLPFGKFFHIFQRPAQLGVSFYKDLGERKPATCPPVWRRLCLGDDGQGPDDRRTRTGLRLPGRRRAWPLPARVPGRAGGRCSAWLRAPCGASG